MHDPFRHAAVFREVHAALRDRGLEPSSAQQKQISRVIHEAAYGLTAADPVTASLAVMGIEPVEPPVEAQIEPAPPKPEPAEPKPAAPAEPRLRRLDDLPEMERKRFSRELMDYIDGKPGALAKRALARKYGISKRQVDNDEQRLRQLKAARENGDRS